MKSPFTLAFKEIIEERALPEETVLAALSQALVSAYRRDARVISSQRIEAGIDPASGQPYVLVEKEVVDDVFNAQTEVELSEALAEDPTAELGELVMVPVRNLSSNFGRIAAQTAKQVILQHIREAERETLYNEYIEREGELTIGTVQSVSSAAITLDLGRAEAIMPAQHRIPQEHYRPHSKIRVYIAEVKRSSRGPQIIVSRNHKGMLKRLLEYEVPEIYNGQIEIKSIAREAGQRSKVAVMALQDGIDPVGACVGMRGMRIQNIVNELNKEKIDIIEYDADPVKYIARALSPARVSKVFLEEDVNSIRTATVIVPEDQLSLAIGKEGQNARLAAKLTGWRIDIKSVMEAAQEIMAHIDESPYDQLQNTHEELLTSTADIIGKRVAHRVITPEEYRQVQEFVQLALSLMYDRREDDLATRWEMVETVRPLVPEAAFLMPLESLELAEDIMRVIRPMGNVGELWVRFMADEDGLAQTLKRGKAGDDAMEAIRDALDDLVVPEVINGQLVEADSAEAEALTAEVAAESGLETEASIEAEPISAEAAIMQDSIMEDDLEEKYEFMAEAEAEAPDGIMLEQESVPEAAPEPQSFAEVVAASDPLLDYETFVDEIEDDEVDILGDGTGTGKKKATDKKGKNKRRQLVFDEDIGEVVAKRRRKRGGDDDIDEYDEYF